MLKNLRTSISAVLITAFVGSSLYIPRAEAGEVVVPIMPVPGAMVNLSPAFTPAYLKGIVIHPENALQFDFLVHKGDGNLTVDQKKQEYNKLVKYFLASLTIPDHDQWVNLSPYEKGRIIESGFGKTEMGRDLLAQDYLLKQITSSLMYPESGLGKSFWDKVYQRAQQEFGSTNVPVNTFNKVWIVKDEALVYENGNTAYVVKSHLKVMLEEDYLSLSRHPEAQSAEGSQKEQPKTHTVASKVIREVILPALEKEVNEGKNFAQLRQIYSGMLLATWYKKALKESLLGKIYTDKAKVKGVDQNPKNNEAIYQKYLAAFKKGVYNYVKEETDPATQTTIPRKYFAGGAQNAFNKAMISQPVNDETMLRIFAEQKVAEAIDVTGVGLRGYQETSVGANKAMVIGPAVVDNNVRVLRDLLSKGVEGLKQFGSTTGIGVENLWARIDSDGNIRLSSERGTNQPEVLIRIANNEVVGLTPYGIDDPHVNQVLSKTLIALKALPSTASALISEDQPISFRPSKELIALGLDPLDLNFKKESPFVDTLMAHNGNYKEFIQTIDVPKFTGASFFVFTTEKKVGPLQGRVLAFKQWARDLIQRLKGNAAMTTVPGPEFAKMLEPELQKGDRSVPITLNYPIISGNFSQAEQLSRLIELFKANRKPVVLDGDRIVVTFDGYRQNSAGITPTVYIMRADLFQGNPAMITRRTALRGLAAAAVSLSGMAKAEEKPVTSVKGKKKEAPRPEPGGVTFDMSDVGVQAQDALTAIRTIEKYRNHPKESFDPKYLDSLIRTIQSWPPEMGWKISHTTDRRDGSVTLEIKPLERSFGESTQRRDNNNVVVEVRSPYLGTRKGLEGIVERRKLKDQFDNILNTKGQSALKRFGLSSGDEGTKYVWRIEIISTEGKGALGESLGRIEIIRPNQQPVQVDKALMALEDKTSPFGGIDMNAANLNMQIKRDGKGVPLPLAQQDMAQLGQIQGFIPEIIEIQPASVLPILNQLHTKNADHPASIKA